MAVTSSSWDNEEFRYDSNLLLCAVILSFWAKRRKCFLIVASSCSVSLFRASICEEIGEMIKRSSNIKKIKEDDKLKTKLSRGDKLAIFLLIVCKLIILTIRLSFSPAWPLSQNRRGPFCPLSS